MLGTAGYSVFLHCFLLWVPGCVSEDTQSGIFIYCLGNSSMGNRRREELPVIIFQISQNVSAYQKNKRIAMFGREHGVGCRI